MNILSTFCLCIFTVLLSFSALAQDWVVGVKGGFNIANMGVSSSLDLGSKPGFHIGGFASTELTDQFIIQPEVQYSLQGWQDDSEDNIQVSYLNVPVVVKYFLVDQFSVHAGPHVGFLLAAEGGRRDILKSVDIGVSLGAEYGINESFGGGLRYMVGFLDVLDNPGTVQTFSNRVFQVFVAYRFNQ